VRKLIVGFIGKANPENASHDDLAILYQSLLPQLPRDPNPYLLPERHGE
jgi:hypothetical protein